MSLSTIMERPEASVATEDHDNDEGDFSFIYEASDDDAVDRAVAMEMDPFTGVPITPVAPASPTLVAPSAAPVTPPVDVGTSATPSSRCV
ncbi:hypothetical protein U1Q18_039577 [Sarracenia purpurea var. burkii]